MMKKMLVFIFMIDLIGVIIPAYGANHYVDKNASGSNNGSSWSNAWTSFSAINWGSISAGDVIYISGGNDSTIYNETLTVGKSGTSSSRIVIAKGTDSGHNGKVIIEGGGSLTNGINISGDSYVTIRGIIMRNSNEGLIEISNSNYIIIEECEMYVYGRAGIHIQYSTGSEIRGNIIETGSYVNSQTDGIYSQFNTDNVYHHNHIVVNNSEPTGHDDCIQSYEDNNLTIHSNYCEQNNNKTSNAQGIYATTPTGGVFKFYNNIVNLGNSQSNGMSYRKLTGTGTVEIIGNTLYGNTSYSLMYVTETSDPVIKNNIIYSEGTTYAARLLNWSGNAGNIDNNIVYVPNAGNVWNFNGSSKSWSQWRALGFDAQGKNADPKFKNKSNRDFSLQDTSPGIDAGETTGSPYNVDIMGITRPQGQNYDMGAYENNGQNPDIIPPEVTGAIISNTTTVVVSFSEALQEAGAENPANYSISGGITVSSAVLNGTQVTLTTSAHTYNQQYTVTVSNVKDLAGNLINPQANSAQYLLQGDTTPPEVTGASITNTTTVIVSFSEALQSSGAQNPANYSISGGITVSSAVLNGTQVTLTTSVHTYNQQYTVTVSNVKDLAGNLINPQANSAQYLLQGDTTPPEVTGATITNATTVIVSFSEALEQSSAQTASNYSINNGITVSGAVLSADGKKVTLTTSAHTNGQSYIVTVNNVKDLAGNVISPTANTAGYSFINDTTPPELVGASLSGTRIVLVTFSEEMDEASAENIDNYSIDHGISVDSAALLNGGTVVSLSTSAHSPNTLYTITVNNVTDLAGNIISQQANTAQYQKQGGGSGKSKRHVGHATAQWFQDYTPDRSIDGNADTTSQSRWAGVLTMPDSIIFELDAICLIDETHFSFYRWDQGRIYHFSVQVSVDGINWNEVLTDMISSSSQWTINQFDSVEARYVKLISLNNNESQWAGLWEAEIWGPDQTTQNTIPDEIPSAFGLSQNYPNPFNPATTIKFSLPADQHIKIEVYNIIGELVTELVNRDYAAGNHLVEFNAASFPSGIYLYRLESQSFTDIKKMILLK